MKKRHALVGVAVAGALFLPVTVAAAAPAVFGGGGGGNVCVADVEDLGTVAGYSGEQLEHAATIITVSNEFELGLRGAQIGVMTAMEESTLQNLDYGDEAVNPDGSIADSLGLFQQQGFKGTLAQRMNPTEASRIFYTDLSNLGGWETMEPHIAAHEVQVNADANLYAAHWEEAVEVVAEITGGDDCGSSGTLTADGWSQPTAGDPITSPYGSRTDPISGVSVFHNGTDFSGGAGAPIYSVASGTVADVFQDSYGAWIIEIDHGSGYITWYVHMETEGVLVEKGATVEGGQLIGAQGSSGYSTGPHLHFEVKHNGENIDPVAWLRQHGVEIA